jgi:hypothetical protein
MNVSHDRPTLVPRPQLTPARPSASSPHHPTRPRPRPRPTPPPPSPPCRTPSAPPSRPSPPTTTTTPRPPSPRSRRTRWRRACAAGRPRARACATRSSAAPSACPSPPGASTRCASSSMPSGGLLPWGARWGSTRTFWPGGTASWDGRMSSPVGLFSLLSTVANSLSSWVRVQAVPGLPFRDGAKAGHELVGSRAVALLYLYKKPNHIIASRLRSTANPAGVTCDHLQTTAMMTQYMPPRARIYTSATPG